LGFECNREWVLKKYDTGRHLGLRACARFPVQLPSKDIQPLIARSTFDVSDFLLWVSLFEKLKAEPLERIGVQLFEPLIERIHHLSPEQHIIYVDDSGTDGKSKVASPSSLSPIVLAMNNVWLSDTQSALYNESTP
jgi:hypothetical protein